MEENTYIRPVTVQLPGSIAVFQMIHLRNNTTISLFSDYASLYISSSMFYVLCSKYFSIAECNDMEKIVIFACRLTRIPAYSIFAFSIAESLDFVLKLFVKYF